jgi:hypothetical protein
VFLFDALFGLVGLGLAGFADYGGWLGMPMSRCTLEGTSGSGSVRGRLMPPGRMWAGSILATASATASRDGGGW